MQTEIEKIRHTGLQDIANAASPDDLERVRVAYLGRKGALTQILRGIKDIPDAERAAIGGAANRLYDELDKAITLRREVLLRSGRESVLKTEWLDVTRPGARPPKGHLHPLTKILREMTAIFAGMGFAVVEGPEVETEYYNFDALNIPAEHPTREMWDTFWLQGNQKEIANSKTQFPSKSQSANSKARRNGEKILLRTHTSPVQVRYMEKNNPPFRIIVPGRVYRYEASDASHDIQFYQLEGLLVDRAVSIAHFKAVMREFFSRFFKKDITLRLRPSYFPFTEPSFEVDMSCLSCDGKGCSVCKKTGWLELGGAGMVHPHVFAAAGYGRGEWRGFAFGMGVDRLAMMKYKIPDIRLFRSGDMRFLKQF
ncbi:MAG: phenylalanine--tRNA ligase subunit alpha [Patescibacteria group bacterium]